MARGSSKRDHIDTQAADIERLLNDPAFIRVYDMVEKRILEALMNNKHDGSPEFENFERELCRQLRTMKSLKSVMMAISAGRSLREVIPDNEHGGTNSNNT